MIKLEVSDTMKAAPDRVWAFLTNPGWWRHWWSGHKLQRVDPGWQDGRALVRLCAVLSRRSSACWAGWCGGLMMQTQFRPPSQGGTPATEFSKEDRRWE